ncbi:MAG TPA: prepilin-type N-terminal cleavage/methylation domain-containing protein [Planctomycetota bacterium]|nr:prepilin-type N-terminal cleavage/methylation domain-containing protein [Planctomycetota bacterium]
MYVRAQLRTGARRGFTLIELVVVLAILAAIAGLVIPQVDSLRRSSDKGTASHTIAAVANNTQLYRTLKGVYPDRFDALLEGTTTTSTTTLYPKLSSKVSVAFGTFALTNDSTAGLYLKSLQDVGFNRVMYHDSALPVNFGQNLPGNSGNAQKTLAVGDNVVVLDNSNATSKSKNMIGSVYPTGIPTGVKVIIVGVGQNTTSIGQTMQSAPSYQGVDANTTYNRYFLAFAAYATGKRARLLGAFDSTGDYLTQEVDEFNENSVE